MNVQSFLGIALILAGLAMAAREVAGRNYADALKSGGLSLIGGLLLTATTLDGRAAITVALGLGVLGLVLIYAARRISSHENR